MKKILNFGALPLVAFLMAGCDITLKQAKPILSVTSHDQENTGDAEIIQLETPGYHTNEILAARSVYFSDVIASVEEAANPVVSAEIISGLLIKSDRVCKQYLFDLVQLRNGYKITGQALGALPTILSVFSLPGSDIVTATRINAVKAGVSNSLMDIGLDETAVLNDLREIQSIRKKMRAAIFKALDNNIKIGYVGIEADTGQNEGYSTFSALLDLETYHEACSLYEKIYFDFQESDKLSELNAYRSLPNTSRLTIAEGN